jgi:hypothetical protein
MLLLLPNQIGIIIPSCLVGFNTIIIPSGGGVVNNKKKPGDPFGRAIPSASHPNEGLTIFA